MGFFSSKKRKVVGGMFALVFIVIFILSLGPYLGIDAAKRKSYVSKLTNKDQKLIPGTEEITYQPRPGSTSSKKFSFAYIHGFSGSRPELYPLLENLGDYFGAAVFFTRLTGHGIDDHGESLSKGECYDWLNDADRTIANSKVPGHELVLFGMSFGALMSSFAALEHQAEIKALVLISPIFELPNPVAKFVSGPLGPILARLILGPIHEFTPINELNAKYWTTRYSTNVISQLMDCENYMRKQDFSRIKIPLLVLYTEKDAVVSIQAIKNRFKDFGSPIKLLVEVPGATDHVLTGDIINPQTLPFVEKTVKDFLESL